MTGVLLIRTDVGDFKPPHDIAKRYHSARKRKDGFRLDRRTKEGRALYAWERQFCADRVREWVAES